MGHSDLDPVIHRRRPWNVGRNVGAKRPLKPKDIWAIRFYLDEHRRFRDRALFDLAIDSKLRGCDLVKLKIGDVVSAGQVRNRATVMQQKTSRPVQFEIMTEARKSLEAWLQRRHGTVQDFVFPSRIDYMGHLSTRQYARLVDEWVTTIGLDFLGGRIQDYEETSAGVTVHWRSRGSDVIEQLDVARLVNCTGPQGDVLRSHDPHIVQLLKDGFIRPDTLRLGIDTDGYGYVVGKDERSSKHDGNIGQARTMRLCRDCSRLGRSTNQTGADNRCRPERKGASSRSNRSAVRAHPTPPLTNRSKHAARPTPATPRRAR